MPLNKETKQKYVFTEFLGLRQSVTKGHFLSGIKLSELRDFHLLDRLFKQD